MKKLVYLLLIPFLAWACEDEENIGTPKEYQIDGKVEKGPFVSGSSVTLQPLDQNLQLTGQSYLKEITSDEGDFNFETITLESPYAQLTANGYYFNEVEGELSGPITLSALVDLSDATSVNVNILTHLKKDRVKQLMDNNKSFKEANRQAQEEVLTAFGLQKYTGKDASKFSITAGTEEAAALIVASSAILYDKTDAQFTEYLSKLCGEFKNGLSDKYKEELRENTLTMDLDRITENILYRYEELGKDIEVMDLSYFVDWDGDGIAGNELGEPGTEPFLKFENTTLEVGAEGGEYTITVESNIPFSFTPPGDEPINIENPDSHIFNMGSIKYTTSDIENKKFKIQVAPAGSFMMRDASLTIYSLNGKQTATLTITQEGDKSKPIFSSAYMIEYISLSSTAYVWSHIIEDIYSNTSRWEYLDVDGQFYTHNVEPYNPNLEKCFNAHYNALKQLNMAYTVTTLPRELNSAFKTLSAMHYYQLAILWGNVPYVMDYDNPYHSLQLAETALFAEFENDLKEAIETLDTQNNDNKTLDGLLYPSRNVARGILAKMYMYTKRYNEAIELLSAIVNEGTYSLEDISNAYGENSKEIMYGFYNPPRPGTRSITQDGFVTTLNYTEIMLSLSECLYKVGKLAEAETYLALLANVKGVNYYPGTDYMAALTSFWEGLLPGTGTYFAFLKRNELAQSVLAIEEDYKLLLPIPEREIVMNPYLKQNPGYNK